MDADERTMLRRVADYQFGRDAGRALFPDGADLRIQHTSSGRVEQVLADDGRLVTYGTDGRFTLGVAGGRRLLDAGTDYRVVIGEESEPYLRDGRNAFAKFVRVVDDVVRPGDEVCVVGDNGSLLAVGRAELPAAGMRDFDTGMAVKVREGAGEG